MGHVFMEGGNIVTQLKEGFAWKVYRTPDNGIIENFMGIDMTVDKIFMCNRIRINKNQEVTS
jgi:hypothetical protein